MRPIGFLEAAAQEQAQRVSNRGAVVRRLLAELRPHRRTLLSALGFVVVAALSQAAGPWLVGRAIDRDIGGGDAWGLLQTMLLLFGVYVAGALAARAQVRRVGAIAQHVLAELRARLFDRLQVLPLSYFDRRPLGDLMSRLLSDVDTLSQLLSQGMTQLLGAMLGLVGIMIAMLVLDVRLALVCFTVIPTMLGTTAFFAARARAAYRRTRKTVGDVTADLQEEIGGIREAQAFSRTAENIRRFAARNAANRDANVAAVGITSAFPPSIDVLSTLSIALVVGYGGSRVVAGQLSIGLLAAFLLYVQQFFRPLQLAASVYALSQSALAGSERIFGILDEATEPPDDGDAIVLGQTEGRLRFENVSFGYDPARPVLHDVDFEVAPGQSVALVGKTGAGKTTISSLIPRFYDPTAGTVRIDGHDLRSVSRASLRAQMAVVLQEPFSFSGTVAANIGYGRQGATREQIEAAARVARAHDFIAELPAGYDAVLGEGGATLSQGQRQLLALARALLADPRIGILDEAPASIDARTEAQIQQALTRVLAGRTSIVIAHRLSTVRNADLLLVIDAGRIVERGTHDSLVAAGGRYAALVREQFGTA